MPLKIILIIAPETVVVLIGQQKTKKDSKIIAEIDAKAQGGFNLFNVIGQHFIW